MNNIARLALATAVTLTAAAGAAGAVSAKGKNSAIGPMYHKHGSVNKTGIIAPMYRPKSRIGIVDPHPTARFGLRRLRFQSGKHSSKRY